MAPFPFSSFRKHQAIFEIQYPESYLLWDRSGYVWRAIESNFKVIKSNQVSPNQTIFFGDDRFTMSIALDRASITDHRPSATLEDTHKTFAEFMGYVMQALETRLLKRIGNRYLYTVDCKTEEEARKKVQAAIQGSVPKRELFSLKPDSVFPTFKLEGDDGEIGYLAQLYYRTQKIEITPPPEAIVIGFEKGEKFAYQLVLDLDLFTKKPLPVDGFNPLTWIAAWSKNAARDADAFLDLAEGRR